MRRFLLVLIAAASFGFLIPAPAEAATFVVTSSADTVDANPGDGTCANSIGGCTLRAAIQEANALAGTDTITLPDTLGTYFFQLPGIDENAAATGDLDITSTITINGAGATTTIIHANNIDRVFDVRSGSLTLNNVTVRNGEAPVDPVLEFPVGGGIFVNPGTSLTLTNSIVRFNELAPGGYGGGILALSFDPAIATTVVIANSTIRQNFAPSLGGSCGFDCQGGAGGLGFFGPMTVTISNSTISGNTAEDGGGIAAGTAGSDVSATVTITGSTISGNSVARRGGGTAGAMTIANSTISGNSAGELAGAVLYDEFSFVQLTNVTITNNSSGVGGAIAGDNCNGSCPTGELRVQNTIIANNTGTASANCATGGGNNITDLGNNLEFPGTACGFALASDVRANPVLSGLASNGGPTETHALGSSSPAIDAGNDAACAASPVSGFDQRGFSRPFGACDIGAYEFAATGIVTDPLLDLNNDSLGDAFLYNIVTGAYSMQVNNGSGFSGSSSTWDAGWQLFPVNLNGDGFTDIFLYDPARGIWVQARNNSGDGSFAYTVGNWDRDWQVYPADFNGNGITDVFVYNFTTGVWVKCFVDGAGDFSTYRVGQWDPGWTITTADLNGDSRDDFHVYNGSNGVWVEAFSQTGFGDFDYPASGQWDVGWEIHPADLNGDGRTDLFLYSTPRGQNPAGLNVTALSRAAGDFDYPFVRQWDAGWTISPGDLNNDNRTDLFLYNFNSGVWVEAFSDGAGDFTYAVGQWDPGWTVRVTDFDADGRADILVSRPDGVWVQATNIANGTFWERAGNWGTGWTVFTRKAPNR